MFIHLRWLDLSRSDMTGKDLETICQLYNMQTLLLQDCNLEEITREIGNLIHLRHLNLSENRSLKELPREIGNLIHLIHLNLGANESLKELPESICDLKELQKLNINECKGICRLPRGFHRLVNLKHLYNKYNGFFEQFPQGVAQLTGLRTLTEFHAGGGMGKLGWLKKLNLLSGYLKLFVHLFGSENIVEDAKEGELRKKDRIQELVIEFDSGSVEIEDREWVSLLDALEPQPDIRWLKINDYRGSKLPSWWMVSPLNKLKFICLYELSELSSLPPLGRLPCLEDIVIFYIYKLQVVGPEFLGTTTEGSNSYSSIVFPKLKKLTFEGCYNWREWEDITTQEADSCDWREWEDITTTEEAAPDSAVSSVMPCLKELEIYNCNRLRALPNRLLASSLEKLAITGSTQLKTRYGNGEGSAWKSISDICPRLRLVIVCWETRSISSGPRPGNRCDVCVARAAFEWYCIVFVEYTIPIS